MLLFLLLLAPGLQAQCENQMNLPPPPAFMAGTVKCPPGVYAPNPVPYVYVTPIASQRPMGYSPGARYSAPMIAVGVTPDSGPVVIHSYPRHGTTHIVQKGKITTCFRVGANTVVCQ